MQGLPAPGTAKLGNAEIRGSFLRTDQLQEEWGLTRRVLGSQRTLTRTQHAPLHFARLSIDLVFFSLGASPKWVFAPAWPFRLGFGCTNFLRNKTQ
jgi:hypothetical protein